MAYECPHCSAEIADIVPKARLDKERAKRSAAEEAATAHEQAIAEWQAKAEQGAAAAEELAAYKSKEQAWTEERAIIGAGITDAEGIQMARLAWSAVPSDQRPEGGVAEWLPSAPRGVRAYLPDAKPSEPRSAAPAPASSAPPAAAPPAVVPSPVAGRQPTGAAPLFGAGDAARMPANEWAAKRASYYESLGLRAPDIRRTDG